MKNIIILYIPVLHEGYIKFFEKYAKQADVLYVLGQELIDEFSYLHKEIRAIDPEVMKQLIRSLYIFADVRILTHELIQELSGCNILTANEGVSERVIDKYFKNSFVIFDSVFLRWDEKHISAQKPVIHKKVSTDDADRKIIALAEKQSDKSSDWWRHVGAVITKNGENIFEGYNKHVPSEHIPYAFGDIRDFVKAGQKSDVSSALHAEQTIITAAAKHVLEGASIYLTVFPCVVCAKLIAYSGIKKVYFSGGHATFDGEDVLNANGVETILVKE